MASTWLAASGETQPGIVSLSALAEAVEDGLRGDRARSMDSPLPPGGCRNQAALTSIFSLMPAASSSACIASLTKSASG